MPAPLYSAADYLGALQALMPRGRVWPRDTTAVQSKVLAGLTRSYAVQNARSNALLVDAFPATTNELLPEWESTLGLPTVAMGAAPSMLARQTLVTARFVGAGGMSIPSYRRYAALLGYSVQIQPHAPFRCGQSHCGQSVGALEQMFGWTASTPASTVTPFGAYGPAVLRSELDRVAPPHAVLNVVFT